jgi:hypothetical protein
MARVAGGLKAKAAPLCAVSSRLKELVMWRPARSKTG